MVSEIEANMDKKPKLFVPGPLRKKKKKPANSDNRERFFRYDSKSTVNKIINWQIGFRQNSKFTFKIQKTL